MKCLPITAKPHIINRRGSTLVIVLALLGLLTFTGVLFFTFASQEKSASEYFADAAKNDTNIDSTDFFEFGLRQILIGPNDNERNSVLYSPRRRHAIVQNAFGTDISPFNGGRGIEIEYSPAGVPIQRFPTRTPGTAVENFLDMLDSPVAWGLQPNQQTSNQELSSLFQLRGTNPQVARVPEADVGYTSPDINNMFLAYRGDTIRDNGVGSNPRFERVPVIVPSFFRPALIKSLGGTNVPMDQDWATDDPANVEFARRSFRPHPAHLTRNFDTGDVSPRYFRNAAEAMAAGLISGEFPFIPDNASSGPPGTSGTDDPLLRGECGIWTGSFPTTYELDVDNDMFEESDGSTSREGIWLDLDFPVQEVTDSSGAQRLFVPLHSFSIYDLDSLINLNVHGNLNNVARSGTVFEDVGAGNWQTNMLSSSNEGVGPHEINPNYALRRTIPSGLTPEITALSNQFVQHYGKDPSAITAVEQANMEWFWLLTGRGVFNGADLDNVFAGRWGEVQQLFRAFANGGNLAQYPRPGRSGDLAATIAAGDGIRYGGDLTTDGTSGFDDNGDRFEGTALRALNQRRYDGLPADITGTGRTVDQRVTGFQANGRANSTGNPLARLTYQDPSTTNSWPQYSGYNVVRELLTADDPSSPFNFSERYIFGADQQIGPTSTDDLLVNARFDSQLDDALEVVFDADLAIRPIDNVFGPQDAFELHMSSGDINGAREAPTRRLSSLAPWALSASSRNRELFTSISNSMRYIPFARNPGWRDWEWTADTDGADRNDDGFPDGDGRLEFPPQFGSVQPNSIQDPFRPQLRRLLRIESGDPSELVGQLPMSWNQIVDVERRWNTEDPNDPNDGFSSAPPDGTPEFFAYIQRAGLVLRSLTPHPDINEAGVASETGFITLNVNSSDPEDENTDGDNVFASANAVAFPPETVQQREFWAMRDRQQKARDIYVLLYTLGGGRLDPSGVPRNYALPNDPNLSDDDPNVLYTHEQLRLMAQFAVNLVDATDRDNVVTRFEYDKNLGNGWNLDDDVLTDDGFPSATFDSGVATDLPLDDYNRVTNFGLNPEDSGSPTGGFERGVVYGVEGSELAINETFAAQTPGLSADHPATLHQDDLGPIQFLQIELQNVSPLTIDLGQQSVNKDQAVWRIARFDRENATDPIAAPNDFQRAMVLLQDALGGSLAGGEIMTISTGSPDLTASVGTLNTSDLYVDVDSTNGYAANDTWERISPDIDSATNNASLVTKGCDIDLHDDADIMTNNVVRVLGDDNSAIQNGSEINTKGAFLEALETYNGNDAMDNFDVLGRNFSNGSNGFDLVLQRRLNPNMPNLPDTVNPWIEVDRVPVRFNRELAIADDTSDPLVVQMALQELTSQQRSQPLGARADRFPNMPATVNHRYNSISNQNGNGVSWTTWHHHPNRPLNSFAEILQLPIVPPALVNNRMQWMNRNPLLQVITGAAATYAEGSGGTQTRPERLSNAAAMFLQPDFPDGQDLGANNLVLQQARDNRWHRILPFIEFPSRVHRMLGDVISQTRIPGKMNLNMIRHPEVYAGLIDNPALMDPAIRVDADGNGFDDGPFTTGTDGVDRWREFIEKRDGIRPTIDPGNGTTPPRVVQVRLPGLPHPDPNNGIDNGIRAFKPLGNDFVETPMSLDSSSIDETILGESDDDVRSINSNRTWLEVGSTDQHNLLGAGVNATQLERQQLLSKIMNNTTTVSNTFIVFATVGLFEAAEDPATGLVRVGGEFDLDEDGDVENDRRRAIFIIDRSDALEAFDPGTRSFDWQRLIKARIDIQ